MGKSLKIIWQIFIRDLGRLVKNPIALLVTVGICLLPSIYAWYCIAANWNPYGETDSLAVGFANCDKGADSEYTGHIDVGAEVESELRQNHELGWQFVDADRAKQGVESGEYYAAIILPESFSEDFVSIFTGDFTSPKIEYYVNEKLSSVAPKITEQGAEEMEKQIDEQFIETVTKSVVGITQRIGEGTESWAENAEGALTADIARANAAINSTRKLMNDVRPTIEQAKSTASETKQEISSLGDAMPELLQDLDSAQGDLAALRDAASGFGTKLATNMTQASIALGKASASAASAIGKASAALSGAAGMAQNANALASNAIASTRNALEAIRPYADGNERILAAISSIERQCSIAEDSLGTLDELQESIASTANASDDAAQRIDDVVRQGTDGIARASSEIQGTTLPAVLQSIDGAGSAIAGLKGALTAMRPTLAQAQDVLDMIGTLLDQTVNAIDAADESLAGMQSNVELALTDLKALQNSAGAKEVQEYLGISAADVGSFMASPVELKTETVYPVRNYGSGVAPFYSNLALWVSGFILMAVVRMRIDPKGLPPFTPRQGYFARWLFYVFIGLIQGFVICVGDLVIGIQCESPIAFVGAGLLAVFVYVNLMYALARAFRHIGKAIAVLLLIMQIPGSSGMYPVEMMPSFYQIIHPLLPFTYSIQAMREAIGGFCGLHYLVDMVLLAAIFIPIGFFIGLFIGKHAFNLNILFDSNLRKTDLFVSENVPAADDAFKLSPVIAALLHTDEYRHRLIDRAKRFKHGYRKMTDAGWVAVFALPVATLVVMFLVDADVNMKLFLLGILVCEIILVDAYLIVISYMNSNITYQIKALGIDADEGDAK